MSTNNSFYRYKIADINDLSESTYLRRRTKASQNNKKSFFFEVESGIKCLNLALEFIEQKTQETDLVCTAITEYEALKTNCPLANLILKITTTEDLSTYENKKNKAAALLFSPKTTLDLKSFSSYYKTNDQTTDIYWIFCPYDPNLTKSITVKDIIKLDISYKLIPSLEILNTKIPAHHELEPLTQTSYKIDWEFSLKDSQPKISIIIPSYNNSLFLSNVVWHLINQTTPRIHYEIIISDDGSSDSSSAFIKQLFEAYKDKVNIRYIYWSKKHPTRGEQQFFRPGLARNLASRYSRGEYLQFLDSDILVPEEFIETCLNEFKNSDVIQFQRFHIHQETSRSNPNYAKIKIKSDTYIEEKDYWSELFFCDQWQALPNYWKYTCTYALGLSKKNFTDIGLFKKYYVSYGFEDTDLGYECHKRALKFSLVKLPLLHLTSYDQMQYKNSFTKRFKLLRATAELFFLQHLDKEIFHLLGNYYRAQKPVKSYFRDLFN